MGPQPLQCMQGSGHHAPRCRPPKGLRLWRWRALPVQAGGKQIAPLRQMLRAHLHKPAAWATPGIAIHCA